MACESATLIDEALARFLVTEQGRLVDGVRERARARIRQLVTDRVFCGRRPESSGELPCVTLDMTGGDPAYHYLNETSCAYDAVQATTWSTVQSVSAELTENLRRLLTAYRTTDPVNAAYWCGKHIASCRMLARPRLITMRAFDGSDEWYFAYQTVWRVIHRQLNPSDDAATALR